MRSTAATSAAPATRSTAAREIDAQNVLGMTPLELSVDLSRNDITFFLLSMRGTNADHHGQPPMVATVEKASAKPAAKRVALSAKTVAPKPNLVAMPRQYAGPSDPGTPVPEAGFLGFGRSLQ